MRNLSQDFLAGNPSCEVFANSSSCSSVMLSYISLAAPKSSSGSVSPRFAANATPAAFCWVSDSAGILAILIYFPSGLIVLARHLRLPTWPFPKNHQ